MNYEFPLWEPSAKYVLSPGDPPSWQNADPTLNLGEIAANLKLSPEERLQKHRQRMADYLKREEFFDKLRQGAELISKYHVNPR